MLNAFLLIDEIKEASAIDINFLIPMDETVEKKNNFSKHICSSISIFIIFFRVTGIKSKKGRINKSVADRLQEGFPDV